MGLSFSHSCKNLQARFGRGDQVARWSPFSTRVVASLNLHECCPSFWQSGCKGTSTMAQPCDRLDWHYRMQNRHTYESTSTKGRLLTLKPGMMGVLLYADFVTCSASPNGRRIGPSSLYPSLHPAKHLGNSMQIEGRDHSREDQFSPTPRSYSSCYHHRWEKLEITKSQTSKLDAL